MATEDDVSEPTAASVRPPPRRTVRLVARLLVFLPAIVLAIALSAEVAVRVVYTWALAQRGEFPLVFETVYWPVPPWIGFTSILGSDPDAGLWMRPDVERTYINLFGPLRDLDEIETLFTELLPDVPDWVRARGVWHLRTNDVGVRNDPIGPKADGTFRIVVLGDSWTVGVNVEEQDTYPRRLADGLRRRFPDKRFEVINYGAIGASSETGRRIVARVLELSPDLVVIAYAQNDETGVREGATPPAPIPNAHPADFVQRVLASSEVVKLYHHLGNRTPGQIAALIKQSAMRAPGPAENQAQRVCPFGGTDGGGYRKRMDKLVQSITSSGAAVVLLYNNIPEYVSHCTLVWLQLLARERRLPLVDTSALLAARGAVLQREIEAGLGLTTPPPAPRPPANTATVVFRVDMSPEPAGARPSIMGSGPALADFTPNRLEMFDDATHGDQVAGDGVWSLAVDVGKPGKLTYLYTDGEPAGAWRGLENYRARSFAVHPPEMGTTVYAPVAQFGRRLLRSDVAHTDAAGNVLIADALLDVIAAMPAVRAFADGASPP